MSPRDIDWAELDGSVSRSFEVESNGRLFVDTEVGPIKVEGIEGDCLSVEITCRVEDDDLESASRLLEGISIRLEQNGERGDVSIRVKKKKRLLGWFRDEWIELAIKISCPHRFNVDLETRSGGVTVEGLEGAVRCRTGAGPIVVSKIKGDVDANTHAGAIRARDVDGRVSAVTFAGPIDLGEVSNGLNAKTMAGAVSARVHQQPRSPWTLSSRAGNVALHLADGVGIDLEAQTQQGRIRVEPPITSRQGRTRTSLRGSIHGGGPQVSLRARTGSIWLKNAASATS